LVEVAVLVGVALCLRIAGSVDTTVEVSGTVKAGLAASVMTEAISSTPGGGGTIHIAETTCQLTGLIGIANIARGTIPVGVALNHAVAESVLGTELTNGTVKV